MSHDKINQLIGFIAKNVEANEKLATPVLSAKLAKCVESYPYDQTLGAVATVINKMAVNNTLFIRKADFKSLYNKLYSRNTKFAELFQDELGLKEETSPITTYQRDDSSDVKTYEVGDQVLANALTSVFDNTIPLKEYSLALANSAVKLVSSTLDAWNLKPSRLEVDGGNDKFLVLKASYETPKGVTSFYVPVEINSNKVVEASVFMGNSGPQELNHVSIKSYLTSFAGNKLVVSGAVILGALNKAASENRVVSDAELALTRLNAKREGSTEFSQNQIVGQTISESVKDVITPQHQDFSTFEEQLETPHGQAYFQFGTAVTAGINYLNRELNGFGFKNSQIAVAKSDASTIFYSVAVDSGKIGFTVPVKVVNSKVIIPSIMLCNGSVSTFSADSINNLRVKNATDYKAAAVASPQFSLKPSDLVNNIRIALSENNHSKAEDALNVLANAGDEKAYATGFQIYLNGLTGKKSESSAQSCCSMILKSASSQHPVCGHTNLPVHKVYQDKDGNCRPLYRRGMDETYEGATFMNSKIFG
jgi:hypothetical protein